MLVVEDGYGLVSFTICTHAGRDALTKEPLTSPFVANAHLSDLTLFHDTWHDARHCDEAVAYL
jgi:hypothetical protein